MHAHTKSRVRYRPFIANSRLPPKNKMREIVHLQAGQCGNQIGAKVSKIMFVYEFIQSFLSDKRVFRSLSRCFVPVGVSETTPCEYRCSTYERFLQRFSLNAMT